MSGVQRLELGTFLRTRRSGLRPSDVGLPAMTQSKRRTPGLRREEVAELAGVSVTWYTWLEQGRRITASEQVIDAIARALRLDAVQHRHLRRLAGLVDPEMDHPLLQTPARLQNLVDALTPNLAIVHDKCYDLIAWNAAFARIRIDPSTFPPHQRNLLWWQFTDEHLRARLRDWEPIARAVLGQFRATLARHPNDPRLNGIVADLSRVSAEFRTWWSEYPMQELQSPIVGVEHPEAGLINLELYQSRMIENPDLLLVIQRPATDEDRRRVLAVLS